MKSNEELQKEINERTEEFLKGTDQMVMLLKKTFELERKVELLENKLESTAFVGGQY
jgi:hypothetical protein